MFVNSNPKYSMKSYIIDDTIINGIPRKYNHLKDKTFKNWEIPPWEVFIFENEFLGSGSFSNVYLAKWRETLVVAKVINEENIKNKDLILREIDIMTKLHHPNIVQFFGYIYEPFILIMEYIPNGNLLEKMNTLKKSEKIIVMRDILQGLAYIHNRKPQSLIHRDIKPTNILLTKCNNAKITDFGISKFYNLERTNSFGNLDNAKSNSPLMMDITLNVGTMRYRAPETHLNIPYSKKVDIYSCGILLYEIFENKRYIPNEKIFWKKTNKEIKKIIEEHMLCYNAQDRSNALSILDLLNAEKIFKLEKKYNIFNIFRK